MLQRGRGKNYRDEEYCHKKMAEHIVCVTATGGIPLFTRTRQNAPALSFPVMASLNGVHLFGQNRDVSLISTLTEHNRIVWKTYQESIVLIAIASNDPLHQKRHDKKNQAKDVSMSMSESKQSTVSDAHLLRILDNVFHSLVLLTGLDELCNNTNVERIKRDLRASYKLIDSFLESDRNENNSATIFGDFTQCVDMILCHEASLLQEHLDAFVEAADSTYGCLIAGGRVVCATEKWWLLTGLELALLGRLISVLSPSATSCDVPVYLPHSSPNIPHRLLLFTLISSGVTAGLGPGGVRACVLCGPQPSLTEVQENLVERFWRPGIDTLQKCVQSCITGFPPQLSNLLPGGLLAFLLINRDSCQCVASLTPHIRSDGTVDRIITSSSSNVISQEHLSPALHEFYSEVIGTTFPLPDNIEPVHSDLDLSTKVAPPTSIYALAHYKCSDTHKCFAYRRGPYQLFCIYHPTTVPTFSMRALTEKTLDLLTREEMI